MRRRLFLSLLALACLGLSLPAPSGEAGRAAPPTPAPADPWRGPYPDDPDLPEGFTDTVVATGITGATALVVAPDGRVFVCEQTGALRVVKGDKLLAAPFLKLDVDSYWERGLLGVALDPAFPKKPHVYLCYVAAKPYPHHRVSCFTAKGDVALPGSEVILLKGDDQRKLGGEVPGGHQGGAVHFGKDGKLYVAIGEHTAGAPAQRLDTFLGKLLRINPDGTIPSDNPFYRSAKGKYRAIWALGLRNPFAFAVQPGTGRIFINDVGNSRIEEINEGKPGANYGWPESEGPTTNPKHRGPLYAYDHSVGRSITGGTFYNPARVQFPRRHLGKYFFCDFMDHWVRVLDPDHPDSAEVFATGLAGPVDLAVAPDGSLYYLNRKEWVKDEKFRPGTGSLHRITYAGKDSPAPRLTSQPGDLVVAAGQPATLRVSAAGRPPLRYRWLRGGKPVPGGDAPRLTLRRVTLADDGAVFRCVVSNALGTTKSRKVTLRVLPLREPVRGLRLLRGLDYRSFEGRWDALPEFDHLTPARSGSTTGIDVGLGKRSRDFGFVFAGFLDVPKSGVYSFALDAAGAGRLFVAGVAVASTTGVHGGRGAGGSVGLEAGAHPLLLLYAHRDGAPRLAVRCTGPGLPERALPAGWLARPDPASPAAPAITPPGGTFSGPLLVRLSTVNPGASIRYTTDGSTPSKDSPAYRGPFLLGRSATVTAKVFTTGAESDTVKVSFTVTGKARYGLGPREPVTTLNVPPDPEGLPPLLSQTGVFRSLADLTPNPGIVPYAVNSPLWSDGADKRRWVALPGDARARFAPAGEWRFPPGTVFVKHFELPARPRPRRLETRLLVVGEGGLGYGVTYRWRADGGDAALLKEGLTEDIKIRTPAGGRTVKWTYPGRNDCLACHTRNAGFVLGVKTRQLHGPYTYPQSGVSDNQLRAWAHAGLLDPAPKEEDLPRLARLASLDDARAPAEHRARSYLDSNCAHCHRPGGARGLFDARFDTPLARQNLLDGPVAAADLGVPGAKLLAPGEPGKSIILARMARRKDVYNMPPLASHSVDESAVAVLTEWVRRLPAGPRRK